MKVSFREEVYEAGTGEWWRGKQLHLFVGGKWGVSWNCEAGVCMEHVLQRWIRCNEMAKLVFKGRPRRMAGWCIVKSMKQAIKIQR